MNVAKMVIPLAILLGAFGPARATVIDFDSLTLVNSLVNPIGPPGTVYAEDGFTLTQGPGEPFPLSFFGTLESRFTGSTALFNNTRNGVVTLAEATGATFDLYSIDLAELNGPSVASVTFAANTGATQTFTLDGIAFSPETFSFSNAFLSVTSVSWTQASPFHQFDNICINDPGCAEGSVPEPATLALIGLGLAGFGALRRKKS